MPIVNASMDRIEVSRKEGKPGGVNVNLNIKQVELAEQGIRVSYQYKVDYPPTESLMLIEGQFTYAADKKEQKKIKDYWDTEKKLPDEFAEGVLNNIMWNCSVHGTHLAAATNLLPPVVIPRISKNKGEQKPDEKVRYIG